MVSNTFLFHHHQKRLKLNVQKVNRCKCMIERVINLSENAKSNWDKTFFILIGANNVRANFAPNESSDYTLHLNLKSNNTCVHIKISFLLGPSSLSPKEVWICQLYTSVVAPIHGHYQAHKSRGIKNTRFSCQTFPGLTCLLCLSHPSPHPNFLSCEGRIRILPISFLIFKNFILI